MSSLFWLTDAQMAHLQPFFPQSHGKPRVRGRRLLNGIIFINRNGLQWRDALKEHGPPKTLCNRWKPRTGRFRPVDGTAGVRGGGSEDGDDPLSLIGLQSTAGQRTLPI